MTEAQPVVDLLKDVSVDSFKDEAGRARAKDALLAALGRIQTPWEYARSHVWGQPSTTAAIKTCVDLGLFRKWVDAGGAPKTGPELAQLVGASEQLTTRLLRHLAAMHQIDHVGNGLFALTPFSRELAERAFSDIYTTYSDMNGPVFLALPRHLASTNYADPTDPDHTAWTSMKGGDESFWATLGKDQGLAQAFANTMRHFSKSKPNWVHVYPTETIVDAYKPGHALIVDVGGSQGHDLEKLRAKHPDVPEGSFVLQDLPEVVNDAVVHPTIVRTKHNFFEPNPVKGARVYYLHCILHDWADVKAVQILKTLAPALERGYSKILLNENVVDEEKPDYRTSVSDIMMMSLFNSRERSERMWRELAEQAGLKLTSIYRSPLHFESVIELELA